MKILSIDTSSTICSVALLEDLKVLKELYIDDANTHSTKLMPLIDELLKSQNLTIQDIDLFACGIGPGSFTGIRIGVSTIKAFADVTCKPVIGVTSLESLAWFAKDEGLICSLIDAKHDNLYFGLFEHKNSEYEKLSDFSFENINNIIDFVKNKNNKIIFVGNGSILFKSMIESELENNACFFDTTNSEKYTATAIGEIAFNKFNKGLYGDSNSLIPLYIKKSNAEA